MAHQGALKAGHLAIDLGDHLGLAEIVNLFRALDLAFWRAINTAAREGEKRTKAQGATGAIDRVVLRFHLAVKRGLQILPSRFTLSRGHQARSPIVKDFAKEELVVKAKLLVVNQDIPTQVLWGNRNSVRRKKR